MGLIKLQEVRKAFPGGGDVVDRVSLEIADGEFLVLVGPSGCGKTTLLRMIAGIETVSDGRIIIGEQDATDALPRDRDIAMVFQNYALYPHMTVAENLHFGLRLRKVAKSERETRVAEVIQMLRLSGLEKRRPGELSGGQRQRVAMGRAMVRQPAAFLMDEPLSNLDAKLRVAMRAELSRLHDRLGVTTVYVTHDQTEAMTLGQRVAVLRDGVLQQVAAPQALFHQPANLFVAAFIGSPMINLVAAEIDDGALSFGGNRIAVPEQLLPASSGRVVFGVRPNDIHLAAESDPSLPQISADVEVVEDLGSEAHVLFPIDAPRIDAEALGDADGPGEDDHLLADERALFTAQVNPGNRPAVGERVTFSIDTAALHFFDPESGVAIGSRAAALAGAG